MFLKSAKRLSHLLLRAVITMDIPPPSIARTAPSAARYFELFSLLSYAFAAFLILPWTDQRFFGRCGTGALMQASMSTFFAGICGFLALLALLTVRDPTQKTKIVTRFALSGSAAFFFPMAVINIGQMFLPK
jgi:hypothetical protein